MERTLDDLGSRQADRGRARPGASCSPSRATRTRPRDVLAGAVESAPPGFAGWTLPVEPFLRQLTDSKAFAPVFALLAERAK